MNVFSDILEKAIAKLNTLNEQIAQLSASNNNKGEVTKLMKDKAKLMKLIATIDELLNEKTRNMTSKVDKLQNLIDDAKVIGGKTKKRKLKKNQTKRNRK